MPEWPTISALAKLTMMTSKAVVADGFDDGVGDAWGGHLGGEIVGGNLLGGYEGAVFAGEWLLDASVEEVGDVGVFLGLGYAEVAEVRLRQEVCEKVVHRFGRDDDGEFESFCRTGSCRRSGGWRGFR